MNQMKAAKRREEISPGRKGLLPKAAKRQQNLAQGVSPGFDFRADTSRKALADALSLPHLRSYGMDEHEPPALPRWAIVSRRFAAGQQPLTPWATFCRRFAAKQFIHMQE